MISLSKTIDIFTQILIKRHLRQISSIVIQQSIFLLTFIYQSLFHDLLCIIIFNNSTYQAQTEVPLKKISEWTSDNTRNVDFFQYLATSFALQCKTVHLNLIEVPTYLDKLVSQLVILNRTSKSSLLTPADLFQWLNVCGAFGKTRSESDCADVSRAHSTTLPYTPRLGSRIAPAAPFTLNVVNVFFLTALFTQNIIISILCFWLFTTRNWKKKNIYPNYKEVHTEGILHLKAPGIPVFFSIFFTCNW